MILAYIWTLAVLLSLAVGALTGNIGLLAAAAMEGAQSGITVTLSMAGALCLWSGLGEVMEKSGASRLLSRFFRPLLGRIFPSAAHDDEAMGYLSGNFTANLLGLGNAATPMGIEAAKRLRDPKQPDYATDGLCRLIVLNTASIQLIPANVAAVRLSLGCANPFDILPAVWITSFCSAGLGLGAAVFLGKVWKT